MTTASPPFRGSCLCGAVRFRVTGETKWCAHCHCTMCQRAHGAAFVTWVGVDESDFRIENDRDLRWYASSEDAERGFCRICGSTLFFRSRRWEGEMHIARASFEGAIDREPAAHVFWDTHVDWAAVGDELPRRS